MAAKPSFPKAGPAAIRGAGHSNSLFQRETDSREDADTGGLVWKTESPTPLTGGLLDEHYYFYYPYQARASILGQGGCSPSSLR